MNGDNFNNNGWGREDYVFQTVTNNGKPKTHGWSVAAMIFGILSVICCYFVYTSLIFGLFAIVFAVISRRNLGYFDGMCIAALVTGIIGFVLGVALVFAIIFVDESFLEECQKYLDEYYKQMGMDSD